MFMIAMKSGGNFPPRYSFTCLNILAQEKLGRCLPFAIETPEIPILNKSTIKVAILFCV